jgi:hypothetical protein
MVTKLARDLTQYFVDKNIALLVDDIEELMTIQDVPIRGGAKSPTKCLQVYVNDFCYAATQLEDQSYIPTIRQAAIHGIQSLFPPPAIMRHTEGKHPISVKKLKQGIGDFGTTKDMIGFWFDGIKRTV